MQILFPLFCFNDDDALLWEEDPAEFLRKESDLLEDFWDPRLTGAPFIKQFSFFPFSYGVTCMVSRHERSIGFDEAPCQRLSSRHGLALHFSSSKVVRVFTFFVLQLFRSYM